MNLKLLKDERVKRGFTQKYMAEQLGFKDRSSYCLIEKGKTSVDVELANKIATILDFNRKTTYLVFYAQKVQETSTNLNSISTEEQDKWEPNLQRQ